MEIMVPEVYPQGYGEFTDLLEELRQSVEGDASVAILQKGLQKVQQCFVGKILALSVEDLEPVVASKLVSYQTEIHKQIRLMGTDVMFLQASREAATAQQRLEQVKERIRILIGYAEAVMGVINQ